VLTVEEEALKEGDIHEEKWLGWGEWIASVGMSICSCAEVSMCWWEYLFAFADIVPVRNC